MHVPFHLTYTLGNALQCVIVAFYLVGIIMQTLSSMPNISWNRLTPALSTLCKIVDNLSQFLLQSSFTSCFGMSGSQQLQGLTT